jgi:hypothetical protein
MRFPFPCFPAEFELPDDWLAEASFVGFKPRAEAFRSTETATHAIPLRDIEPPFRYPEHPKDFRGFDRARMVKILAGIVTDVAIEPVQLLLLPRPSFVRAPFEFRVYDGVHRFYAAVAAGFAKLPAFIE